MGKKLECQGAGYVVRNVGYAEVKVWQLNFHEVPVDDLQLLLVGGALYTSGKLENLQPIQHSLLNSNHPGPSSKQNNDIDQDPADSWLSDTCSVLVASNCWL